MIVERHMSNPSPSRFRSRAPKRHRIAGRFGRRLGLQRVTQLLLVFWALMVIFPFLWMIMTSFKTDPEILFSPWNLPDTLQWDNFARAWNEAHIGRYFVNSLIVIIRPWRGHCWFQRWRLCARPLRVSRRRSSTTCSWPG